MHKEFARCYLITDVCLDAVESTAYDQVTKAMGPFRYYTHHESTCSLPADDPPLIPPALGSREECEEICSANLDCGGFAYTPAERSCFFRSIDRSNFDPETYCSGGMMTFASTVDTISTLAPADG